MEEKEKTGQVSCSSSTPAGPMETVLFCQHNFYFLNKGLEGKCWYSAPPFSGHRLYDVQGFLRVHRFLCMGKGAYLYSGVEWLHSDSHVQRSQTLEKML